MSRICNDFAYGDGPVAKCFWTDTVSPTPRAALNEDTTAEVAIIGAGFTGINAALALAEAGVDVVVIDAHQVGWGASGRNGGFCCLGGAKAGDATLTRRFGAEATQDYRLAERDAVDHVDALLERFAIDVDRHSDGETMLAHRPKDAQGLATYAESISATYGVSSEVLPAEALPERGLGTQFHGAVTTPIGFALNPLKYILGLAEAAEKAGVRIFADTKARKISKMGSTWQVTTKTGSIKAQKLVIATNGYSSEDLPDWMAGRYFPVQSSVLVTRKLTQEEQEAQGWTSLQMSYDSRNLLHYFHLMPDGRFIFGMRGGIATSGGVHDAIRNRARGDFDKMFPAWKNVETPWYWAGFVCMSRSMTPFAGAVPDQEGLYAAFAYHGNGVAMGSYCGALVADAILGHDKLRYPRLMTKAPARFPGGRFRRLAMYPAYLGYVLSDL